MDSLYLSSSKISYIRKIFITADSIERSDEVAAFLESRSAVISPKNKNPQYAELVVIAYVPRSLHN